MGSVGVRIGTVVDVVGLITPLGEVAVGVTNPPPGIPLVGGIVVVSGVGVSGMDERTPLMPRMEAAGSVGVIVGCVRGTLDIPNNRGAT